MLALRAPATRALRLKAVAGRSASIAGRNWTPTRLPFLLTTPPSRGISTAGLAKSAASILLPFVKRLDHYLRRAPPLPAGKPLPKHCPSTSDFNAMYPDEQIRYALTCPVPSNFPPLHDSRISAVVFGGLALKNLAEREQNEFWSAFHPDRLEFGGDRLWIAVCVEVLLLLAPTYPLSPPDAPYLGGTNYEASRLTTNVMGAKLARQVKLDFNLKPLADEVKTTKLFADRFEAYIFALYLSNGRRALYEFLVPLIRQEYFAIRHSNTAPPLVRDSVPSVETPSITASPPPANPSPKNATKARVVKTVVKTVAKTVTTKAKTTQVIAAKESKVKAVKVPKSYLAMLEPSPSTSPSEDAEVLSALVSEAEAGEAPSSQAQSKAMRVGPSLSTPPSNVKVKKINSKPAVHPNALRFTSVTVGGRNLESELDQRKFTWRIDRTGPTTDLHVREWDAVIALPPPTLPNRHNTELFLMLRFVRVCVGRGFIVIDPRAPIIPETGSLDDVSPPSSSSASSPSPSSSQTLVNTSNDGSTSTAASDYFQLLKQLQSEVEAIDEESVPSGEEVGLVTELSQNQSSESTASAASAASTEQDEPIKVEENEITYSLVNRDPLLFRYYEFHDAYKVFYRDVLELCPSAREWHIDAVLPSAGSTSRHLHAQATTVKNVVEQLRTQGCAIGANGFKNLPVSASTVAKARRRTKPSTLDPFEQLAKLKQDGYLAEYTLFQRFCVPGSPTIDVYALGEQRGHFISVCVEILIDKGVVELTLPHVPNKKQRDVKVVVSTSLSPVHIPSTTSSVPPILASCATPSSAVSSAPSPTSSSTPPVLPSPTHLATSTSSVVVPPPTAPTTPSATSPAPIEPVGMIELVGTLHWRVVAPVEQPVRKTTPNAELSEEEKLARQRAKNKARRARKRAMILRAQQ